MKTFTKILIVLAGIAMIIMGFWVMFNPVASLLTLNVVIGLLLLISGIFHIISYFTESERHLSGWILADGILSTLLGILMLANQFAGAASLILVFAMWVLFAGIVRTIGAFTLKQAGGSSWGFVLFIGIVGIILGFIALFNPVVSALGIVLLMGFFFILEGIGAIATAFVTGRSK
ncbi:HdeD family acid-resistance protein [Listeria aquatica]|uniref:HdeD family acid-resistance protein n=1 Tax=Listeria aquatica TaxID=1494960 RepID=UPI003F6F1453